MALEEYKQKRKLDKTPEPAGGKPSSQQLAFVVQKHQASHLHYDFRLEMRGVLKSWAVPKGPSMKATEKRLAMLVEDHPYDYKDFEGNIPEGNYGAGTVIVWDEGWYEPAAPVKGKKAQEHELLKQFYAGSLKIKLHGKKLKGVFALIKNAQRGETSWLLSKTKDKDALTTDISVKDKSVVSGKTIEEMAEDKNAREWKSNRSSNGTEKIAKAAIKEPAAIKKKTSAKAKLDPAPVKQGKKLSMPSFVDPMLCTLVKEAFTGDDWLFEIKWDGYRLISRVQKNKVEMLSRSGLDYTSKYPPLVKALKQLQHDVILDGEAVVFNEEGKPDFDALQLYNGHDTPIKYCAFDILWIDGYSLMELPLIERKQILQQLLSGNDIIRYSEHFDDGLALYEQMKQLDLEGMIAKKRNSEYQPGVRGRDWVKIPTRKRQEFVIGGYAESDKARSFRSLLFGAYNQKGEFEWIGRSGGGYKQKHMPGILAQLKKLETDESPFINRVLDTKGAVVHWVKPQLVANFEFATWTKSGRIRKPATFLGFRKDKKPKDVVREVPVSTETIDSDVDIVTETEVTATKSSASTSTTKKSNRTKYKYLNEDSGWQRVDEEQKGAEWTDFEMENCTIPVHHLERELWEGVPKGKLLIYYSQVADYILRYIKDRPQSLNLKLTHAGGPRTFIKDIENRQPDCAEIFADKRRVKKAGKRNQIDYLVCNNRETLIYMVDLGSVDINPWASRVHHPDQPDFLTLDLDPTIEEKLKGKARESAEDKGFAKTIEAALACKKIIDKYKLTGFVKTSGKTGLHIYIPCSGITFAKARTLAYKIADEAHALVPKITTRNESINQRGDKVYIDAGQNDYADTLAAPYSVRPYHSPTVSTPLDWKEIKKGLNGNQFTIDTIQTRLNKKDDPWEKLFNEKIITANNKALNQLKESS